jgi:hypothetical protein
MRLLLGFALLLIATAAQASNPRMLAILQQSPTAQLAPAPSQPPAPGAREPGSPPQTQPSATDQQPGADHSGAEQSPATVKGLPTPRTDAESEKERGQGDDKSSTDRWLMIFTGGLVVVGIVQVLVFGLQALRLKQTIEQMKATEERQLRAYVQTDVNPAITVAIDPNQIAMMPVSLKNCGQTPAYDVEINGRILPYDYPLVGELPDFPKSAEGSRIVIQPGQVFGTHLTADRLWTNHEISRLQANDNIRLYAYGLITYRDAFGQTRRTRFRLMQADRRGDTFRFTYCYNGNDAD